jgi:undecaprenyl-diphosphatase
VFAFLAWTLPLTGPAAFDAPLRAAIHGWASPALTEAMKAATQLGGGFFLFPLGAIVTFALYREGRRRDAALFVIAVLGANILDEGMKLVFRRERPDPWFGYPEPFTYSFPSGHSFVSFCFYFSLAEILIREDWPAARKGATWVAAGLLTLTIGLSRVYLGVHYPTDVIAGFVAAIAWTTAIRVAHHRANPVIATELR